MDVQNKNKIQLIKLPKVKDQRGNLTFIEELKHIPFQIARAYWIYDVPGGEIRGSHAFKEQHEILVALSGSFDVIIHDGQTESRYSLNRSYDALYLPPMTWRRIENFSTNSICLVLSSHYYSENDYIRQFDSFSKSVKGGYQIACTSRGESRTKGLVRKPTAYDSTIIEMPRVIQENGSISIVEGYRDLPYDIKRTYYLYDIPADAERGAHAHKECHRFLVAASGAFDVSVFDGRITRIVRLERPYYGLYIPPGLWTSINGFSSGSICISLASDFYYEDDYIRSYEEYINR